MANDYEASQKYEEMLSMMAKVGVPAKNAAPDQDGNTPMFAENRFAAQLQCKEEQDMARVTYEARKGRMRNLEQTIMDTSSKQPCYSDNTAAKLRYLANRNVWEQATREEEQSDHQSAMASLKLIMSMETVNNWVAMNKKHGGDKQSQLEAFSKYTYWTFPYLKLNSWSNTRKYLVNVLRKLISSCVAEKDDPDDLKQMTRIKAGVLLDKISSNQTAGKYNDLEQLFVNELSLKSLPSERGSSELTKYCLFGGSLHRRDNQGYTLLHRAAKCNAAECAQILIKEGVDVNLPTTRSRNTGTGTASTALHIACMYQSYDVVTLICQAKGVNPNLYNTSGKMPLHVAACVCDGTQMQDNHPCTEKQYEGMLNDLLSAGADLKAVTYYNFDVEVNSNSNSSKKDVARKKLKKGNGHSASDMALMGGPNERTGHDLHQVVLEFLMKHRVPFMSFKSSGFATVKSLYELGVYKIMKKCGVKNRMDAIKKDKDGLVRMNQLLETGEIGCVFEWPGLRMEKTSLMFTLGVDRMRSGSGGGSFRGLGGSGTGGGGSSGCPTQ